MEISDGNLGDSLTYTFEEERDWVRFDEDTHVFTIVTTSETKYGTHEINLRVEDDNTAGYYNTKYLDVSFEIIVRNDKHI